MSSRRRKFLNDLRSRAHISTGQYNLMYSNSPPAPIHEIDTQIHFAMNEYGPDYRCGDCSNPTTSNEVHQDNVCDTGLNSDSSTTDNEREDDRDMDYAVPASSSSDAENIPLRILRDKSDKKQKISSCNRENITQVKRGRKAVKGDTREARKKRKINRNEGKEYSTIRGKLIRGRTCKDLDDCRKKCREKIDREQRYQIFAEYWKLGSFDKRVAFTSSLILKEEKKTQKIGASKSRKFNYKYHLKLNGLLIEICKGCFKKTLDLSNKFIATVIEKSQISGTTLDDQRGHHPPKNKIEMDRIELVKRHLISIPAYESHYCRERTGDRKFLPSFYTLTRLYEEYKIWISPQQPVSRKVYESIFHTMNISIKKWIKDTCQECDKKQCMIKNAKTLIEKERLTHELSEHQLDAQEAYSAKEQDKDKGKQDQNIRLFTFDLQQCLPTPSLTTSVAFYKRQLWTYNLTMYDCVNNKTTCCMWYETISGRGANQIGSCLYKELLSLPPNIKQIVLYSDTCGGQNKNSHIVAMFMTLMQNSNFQIVDHKFLIPGHTRMECDTVHSIIEKKKKHYESLIEHPRDWFQLVRSCGKKHLFKVQEMKRDDFIDFASLLKSCLQARKVDDHGNKFAWKNVRWIRYNKTFGQFSYKNSHKENESFKEMSFRRRGQNCLPADLPKCKYPNCISEEKKKNLIELLPYIDEVFHSFYENLPTEKNLRDTLPDLDEIPSDID